MMKKIFSNIRTMAALLMAGAAFAACSSSDDTIEQKPAQTGKQVYTLTVNASKAGKASTRALDLDGESLEVTWELNDELTVENSSGKWLGTLTATSVSGSTATFSGELLGSISSGDALTLTYHPTEIDFNFSSVVGADGQKVTSTPSGAFTKQDGTLNGSTKSAENLDFATAEVTVASVDNHKITTTADAVFTTKTALAKVILTDGTNPINATKLKMTGKKYVASKNINLEFDILNFENLSTSITDGIYYFALPSKAAIVDRVVNFLSQSPSLSWIDEATMNDFMETATFTFTATVGDDTYTVEKTGYKFEAGKYYKNVTLTMAKVVDLSTLTADYVAQNGDVLLGALGANVKISIADGATVTLNNATINGVNSSDYAWAGLTCEGSATIILKDGTTNIVTGFCEGYPGIYVPTIPTIPTTGTVTIKGETEGTGVLNAQGCVSATYGNRTAGAGIGAGASLPCGNIVIEGGVINATGGYACAAIGGAFLAACGDITITGGTVTASGSASAAGIGGGWYSTSGNIEITGGTVNARSNEVLNTTDGGPGIGCGALCVGGNITIGGTAHVTAQSGDLGAGIGTGGAGAGNSICGDILINGGTVTATAVSYGAGIGSGINSIGTTCQCGTITITSDVTKVTATKGTDPNSLCSIGVGFYYNDGATIMSSTSGAVTIGGTEYWDGSAYQNGGDTYLTQSPLVYEPGK